MNRKLTAWALFASFILVFSCVKEKSIEHSLSASSSGSLKTSSGDCLPSASNGIFKTGIALTAASNYIDIQVTVTKTGSYLITTDTLNGFSFKGEGAFTVVGLNTVRLTGSGKPLNAITSTFHFTYDSDICSIDISVIDANTPSAVFTLGADASKSCTGSVPGGNYQVGTPLDISNTVTITVNVTIPGAYTLGVTPADGITFKKTGVFTGTGAQQITLTASGTPSNAGSFSFTINGASNTCSFSITVNPKAGSTPAVFTLNGAPGACTSPVISGAYQAGVSLNSANTIAVKLDVTTAGSYTLSTDLVNGISFSATGILAVGAGQTVILNGAGTPTSQGTFVLTPQFGNSSCTFSLIVDVAPPVTPGVYTCKIDGVFMAFNDRSGFSTDDGFGGIQLYLDGHTGPANGGTVPELQLFIINNNKTLVKAGTYNVDGFAFGGPSGYEIEIDYKEVNPDLSVTLWNTSSSLLSTHPPFTIKVTSVTATRVQGTFSGTITNIVQGSTIKKIVTEGTFDLPFAP
ncbi:hypothetical protein ACX0G9_03190 [Flavitalea flava]